MGTFCKLAGLLASWPSVLLCLGKFLSSCFSALCLTYTVYTYTYIQRRGGLFKCKRYNSERHSTGKPQLLGCPVWSTAPWPVMNCTVFQFPASTAIHIHRNIIYDTSVIWYITFILIQLLNTGVISLKIQLSSLLRMLFYVIVVRQR